MALNISYIIRPNLNVVTPSKRAELARRQLERNFLKNPNLFLFFQGNFFIQCPSRLKSIDTMATTFYLFTFLFLLYKAQALNIVLAGGSGKVGKRIIPMLANHDVTVLSRNAFLASAPARVTEVFGYLGQSFLNKNQHVKLRDWDGGDLLDIVGKDWVGWQEDALEPADVVVHLVGGFTEQRTKAAERLVRESFRVNPNALHITVNPVEEDIPKLTPGMVTLKTKRIQDCEDMVKNNLSNSVCLRLEAYNMDQTCEEIYQAVEGWAQ